MGKYIKEVTVRDKGHKFSLYLGTSGIVDCSIDNGAVFSAKELSDGKVVFFKPQEIAVKGELIKIDCLELDESLYGEWKSDLDLILSKKNEEQFLTFSDGKKEALLYVDRWDRKVRGYKDKDKVRRKMCIHTFRIGNDIYTFVERSFPDKGIVINPDYRISESVPDIGGVPKQYGELLFWDYFFEGEGWKRVRVLSNNEQICVSVIQKYGYFSSPHKVDCLRDKKKSGVFVAKNTKPLKNEKKSGDGSSAKPKKKGFFLSRKNNIDGVEQS